MGRSPVTRRTATTAQSLRRWGLTPFFWAAGVLRGEWRCCSCLPASYVPYSACPSILYLDAPSCKACERLPEVMFGEMRSGVLRMSARPCGGDTHTTHKHTDTTVSSSSRDVHSCVWVAKDSGGRDRLPAYRQHETPVGNWTCTQQDGSSTK